MKILVTGCSGTIGTRLCETLLQSEHEVVGVDWEPNKWLPAVEEIRIDADLRDENAMSEVPTDIDLIIHLAANARVYELVENPDRARDNMLSTFNVLEFARKNAVPKLMFASSREVYGNANAEMFSEDMVAVNECESPYTASKLAGEALVHAYRDCYDIGAVIFRFSNVYGMYDDSIRVVPLFIRLATANETLTVFGEGKCLDFTYIDDCIDGILRGIERFEHVEGETLNLAVGQGSTIKRLAEKIIELTGSDSQINIEPSRTGEIMQYVADISRAQELLDFAPQTPFDQGIEKAVEWYSQNT